MLNETCIVEALHALVVKLNYKIFKMEYEDKHFGNFMIELCTEGLFGIRFIRDRGQLWCEVNHGADWLLINDIFSVIGVNLSYNPDNDYCKNISMISNAIYQNFNSLGKALDKDNFRITLRKIEEIKQKRVETLLKKYNNR